MRIRIQPAFLFLFLFLIFIRVSLPQEETPEGRNSAFSLQDTAFANNYLIKGDSLLNASQFDSSNFYYKEAKQIYESLNQNSYSDLIFEKILSCENRINRNYIQQGKYNEAIQNLTVILESGINKFEENNPEVAQSFDHLGSGYRHIGNFKTSLENYNKALSIRIKIYGEENPDVASTYNSIGILYWNMGEFDSALGFVEKSLSIRQRILGNEHRLVGDNYNVLGIIYMNKGDYDKALEYYQESLSIWSRSLGNEHPNIADSYNNIGIVYYNQGEYDLSLEHYQKALSLLIKLLGNDHPKVAYLYNNIAIIHAVKNEYDLALEYLQKSLDIRLPIMGEENSIIVITYTNFGDIYTKKGDYNKALEYYDKALNIGLKVMGKYHPSIAELYLSVAVIKYQEKDFINALINCQEAIKSLVNNFKSDSFHINPPLDQINSELQLLSTLTLKAKIFEDMPVMSLGNETDNLKMALATYQLAADLIDKIRTGYKSESSQLFLGEQTYEIYDQAIQTSLKLYEMTNDEKYFSQAFVITEKSKAAVLQKGLYEIQAKQFGNIPAELLEDEKQLRINLASFDTELQNELTKKESTDTLKINDYQNKIFNLKTKYDDLISGFEKDYPEYFNLKYQTRSLSVLEIQEQLDENTVLAEYFVGDSLINIFTISKSSFDITTIQKPDNFSEILKTFYSSILKTETEKYISSGNKLSRLLVFPVTDKIKSKVKLVIIPHDVLFKIPFDALFTSEQKNTDYTKLNYLINSFDISYHYSSALFIDNLKKEKENIWENSTKNFGGFAPVFPKDDLTGYTLASRSEEKKFQLDDELRFSLFEGNKYNELKYSKWEVESILKLLKTNNNNGYYFSDATEENFKSNVNKFNIVHIASHSFINESHPQISGIVFAQPINKTSSDDGILYSAETYNLDLNADLVVLSSCESGLGKLFKGEGLMALTRGFLYSGADNIIFSLWKIPDKHTSELMIEFYKCMLSGKSYSESLRKAKLTLIENESTSRPRSWASFVLVGSD